MTVPFAFVRIAGMWVTPMAPAVHTVGLGFAAPFFVVAMLIGSYLMLNLFVSVLLKDFMARDGLDGGKETANEVVEGPSGKVRPSEAPESTTEDVEGGGHLKRGYWESHAGYVQLGDDGDPRLRRSASSMALEGWVRKPSWPDDYSLLCFETAHPLRVACASLSASKIFGLLIIFCIVVSSLTLAFDTPRLDPESKLKQVLAVFDVVWAVVFTFEMGVKVVAQGFIFGSDAYLKSAWNVLDFIIVCATDAVLLDDAVPALASLKTLRARERL